MIKLTQKTILMTAICALGINVNAQPWMNDVTDPEPSFFEIQDAFYSYWKDRPIEKGKGYKQFKRWEWYWESRVYADGSFPESSANWDAWKDYRRSQASASTKNASSANWSFEGPSTTPGGYNGLGRLNCMAFHPTDANTFWVGSPSGGLWKTTDAGSTWTTNTDDLPVLGVSDIAIDPNNPSTMYIATGDGDPGSLSALNGTAAGDTKSVGVLKSTDGGATWNTTGLNWSVTDSKLIRRLVMNPGYPLELMAATSDGIWLTVNGGDTWSQAQTGYFMDLEFKPNNSDTAYAASYEQGGNSQIYRTIDYGQNWTSVATLTDASRINLAVTPAWPNLVDALATNASGGLRGLWYSNTSGASFTEYFTGTNSNNLLHSSYNGSGSDGQGHYDLAYAINPVDFNEIWIGGVNAWNSTNGGSSWNLKSMWTDHPVDNPNGVPEVHADKHFIAFHPLQPNTMFECNDGGLYKTTDGGATWTDLSNGLQISQLYRIGVSQSTSDLVMCGLQDNGSRQLSNNAWYERTGGDGMECIIDYSDDNVQYGTYINGVIYRTTNFWSNSTTISDNIPGNSANEGSGAWVTPYAIDPVTPSTLYVGYNQVYKTTDMGDTWTSISQVLPGLLRSLVVAPSNPNYIYAANFDNVYRTTDGGLNWFTLSPTSANPNAKISYLSVSETDPMSIVLTKSGYVSGDKVWASSDGGVNWVNQSGSLPNVSVNCIVRENVTAGIGAYVGTDLGVFYTDLNLGDWVPYQLGLPNVVTTELEISYNDNKLWAATYGRGLWKSDLYSDPTNVSDQLVSKDELMVYPNPNGGIFNIELPEGDTWEIVVYNLVGEIVKGLVSNGGQNVSVDITGHASGIYNVQAIRNNVVLTKKVVLQQSQGN